MASKKKDFSIDWSKYSLRPAQSYLDSALSDLKDMRDEIMEMRKNTASASGTVENVSQGMPDIDELLSSMKEADDAARALLEETKKTDALSKDAPRTKAEEAPEKPDLEPLLEELDGLVGLEKIKQNVRSLMNLMKIRKLREEAGLKVPAISLHMVFMGNPGTGKTTVARLISQLYCAIGVLSKGQLIEVDRAGLVAGFVGQTAIKTQEVIKSALGGVLFIDEAYSLTPETNGSNDFGHEAVETILKAMEDHRDDLVVIVAGYSEPMERFIHSNPGLESRFNRYLMFPDYNGEELYRIFLLRCEKNGYLLSEEADEYARELFQNLYEQRDENFGNARDVRNLFENAVSIQADRLASEEAPDRDALMTLTKEDLEKAETYGA